MKTKVSIIIVHYKADNELFSCVSSIKKSTPKIKFEVIVVDNDEKKKIKSNLLHKYPWITYIEAPGNVGYGAGINLGVEVARGEYILVLNPDTRIIGGAIESLARFLDNNKKTAIVAPNLLNKKGTTYPQFGSEILTPIRGVFALSFLNKLFPDNKISRDYYLSDIPKNKEREVGAVPGSAFMIKEKIFRKIGGFDEIFFLFFEESDLCLRVKELGYKIFIIPEAEVMHLKGRSTTEGKKINKIFSKSRYYFFKKHYGVLAAVIVEAFSRFSKWHAGFLLIILLGTLLRLFKIEETLIFHGELGFDYYSIKNYVTNREIPLLGPPTSHPWFALGPVFYWIFSLLLPIGNWDPIIGAYTFAVVGISAIILCFYVVREFFGSRAALISSFLIAISPFWMELTRRARFNYPMAVLFFPLYYFLTKTLITKGKHFFWTGLFLGLTSHFFGGYFVLIIAVGVLILARIRDFKRKDLLKGFTGFLIPLIPFLIHNAMTKFDMLIKITLWIPYRILGFVGLYPKNTATPAIIQSNFTVLYDFFVNSWVKNVEIFAIVLFATVIFFSIIKTKRSFRWKKINIPWLVLMVLFTVSYIGIFVHGDPPLHYFLIVFPIPIIILSIFLSEIFDKRGGKILVVLILSLFTILNFRFYFSERWFFRPQERFVLEDVLVPYKIQEEIVQVIYKDAGGKEYELGRVGPYDQFEADYALNYHYLLWRLGNEPVEKSNLKYTIYEDTSSLDITSSKDIFWVDTIAILKEGE